MQTTLRASSRIASCCPHCLCRQPWSVHELRVPADGGKRAREWAEKLQMNTLRFFLDQFLDRLDDKA